MEKQKTLKLLRIRAYHCCGGGIDWTTSTMIGEQTIADALVDVLSTLPSDCTESESLLKRKIILN